jgi:DNA-binding CsgD family transcriptional regulator
MTAPRNITNNPSAASQTVVSSNSQEVINLLVSSFHLHLGKISDEVWLENFAQAVNCSAVACVRWTSGHPAYDVTTTFGNQPELAADWKIWADRIVASSTLREPAFIEDFVKASLNQKLYQEKIIDNPQLLVGIVDWEPACIVMLMLRDQDQPEWNRFERNNIARILGYVREAIGVHKELDRRHYIGGLASDILNSSPRGIVALSEDGVIQMANARAEEMLDARDGICRQRGKLLIGDRQAAKALSEHLGNLPNLTGDGLPEMDWNMVAKRPSGEKGYQIILGSIKLHDWNIESRASDRVAIIYLHDLVDTSRPTTTQLRDFYGLTAAQAKLAGAIYNGRSITEAAAELHVSVNTARTHMRGIYAKTGVKTQTELISLLTSGLKTYGQPKE